MANFRLGGIASGMDTESMVKQMVQARRTRVDRYAKNATKNEWVTEAYNNVNQSLANFVLNSRKDLGLTDVDFFGNIKQNSIDKVDWVNKAVSSKESVFTAKASSRAIQGSYDVVVKSLATNATISGNQVVGVNADTKLSALGFTMKNENNGNFNIKINGKDITLNKNMRVSDAMAEIRNKAGININFDNGSHMLFVASKKTGKDNIINIGGTGSVDSKGNPVVDDNTKALFKELGLDEKNIGREERGKNAEITFNGSGVIEYSSNNISINGIDLTLNSVSKVTGTNGKGENIYESTKVTVETDVDSVYNKIKGFVDGYNKIMDELQGKISEKSFRDYQPLTKEEKGELKEEDIKNWEEKAKSGLLSDDRVIRKMISDIRKGLYEKVHSNYDEEGKNEKGSGLGSMYELGITTGNWRDGAKLKIDETKLKEAIKKDPKKVLDVLFQASDDKRVTINKNDSPEERARKQKLIDNRRAETGVFVRIMDSVNLGMENIVKHSGTGKNTDLLTKVNGTMLNDFKTRMGGVSQLKSNLNSINKFIANEERRLKTYEDGLWKKFSAMEKALAKAQQQGSWITQQLGGGM